MTIANQLKQIKNLSILGKTNLFISIAFEIADKSKVLSIIGNLPISIHTQDNLTTATIKLK